jgi:lipopolysaccharide/colanic/teichoic acid biosynthesis glycosyltransferase
MVGLLLTGEGEIWYKQERIGFKNKPFLIWKFATMLKNSSKMAGGIITTKKRSKNYTHGRFFKKK